MSLEDEMRWEAMNYLGLMVEIGVARKLFEDKNLKKPNALMVGKMQKRCIWMILASSLSYRDESYYCTGKIIAGKISGYKLIAVDTDDFFEAAIVELKGDSDE